MTNTVPVSAILSQATSALAAGEEWAVPEVIDSADRCDAFEQINLLLETFESRNGVVPYVAFVAEDLFARLVGASIEDLEAIAERRVDSLSGSELLALDEAVDTIQRVYGVALAVRIPGTIVYRRVTLLPTIDLEAGHAAVLVPQSHISA